MFLKLARVFVRFKGKKPSENEMAKRNKGGPMKAEEGRENVGGQREKGRQKTHKNGPTGAFNSIHSTQGGRGIQKHGGQRGEGTILRADGFIFHFEPKK
jgi:hypothetical protein